MLARVTELLHPTGSISRLPKLVPSFSSKGFARVKSQRTGARISHSSHALDAVGGTIAGAFLLSAFDIFHSLIESPEIYYSEKELIFIDSGGYELSSVMDGTEPHEVDGQDHVRRVEPFTEDEYSSVLKRLPENLPFVIANYDHAAQGLKMDAQIAAAHALFGEYPSLLHDFIVKPTSKQSRFLHIEEIIAHIDNLHEVHILGVTEREIGNSVLNRLANIATLRLAMDDRGINMPIHVWGGLDPVLTPMYFCAGAEIFDGVSWMRYGYHRDTSIPRDAYSVLELGAQEGPGRSAYFRYMHNLNYLEVAEIHMEQFVTEGCADFSLFGTHWEAIETSHRAVMSKIARTRR